MSCNEGSQILLPREQRVPAGRDSQLTRITSVVFSTFWPHRCGVAQLWAYCQGHFPSTCCGNQRLLLLSVVSKQGLLKKKTAACSSAAKDQGGQAARKLGHAVTGDLAFSSRQMFLRTTQEEPGHCQEQNQAKIVKKRRRSLRIFSAHITRNPIEIEVSAPLVSRAMISRSEYFRFPDPKTPSTSFLLRWSALSCCLCAALTSGFFGGLPKRLPDMCMLFLVQKFRFLVVI